MKTHYYFVSFVIQDQLNSKKIEFKNAVCCSHPFEFIEFINNGFQTITQITEPKAILINWRVISRVEFLKYKN